MHNSLADFFLDRSGISRSRRTLVTGPFLKQPPKFVFAGCSRRGSEFWTTRRCVLQSATSGQQIWSLFVCRKQRYNRVAWANLATLLGSKLSEGPGVHEGGGQCFCRDGSFEDIQLGPREVGGRLPVRVLFARVCSRRRLGCQRLAGPAAF